MLAGLSDTLLSAKLHAPPQAAHISTNAYVKQDPLAYRKPWVRGTCMELDLSEIADRY